MDSFFVSFNCTPLNDQKRLSLEKCRNCLGGLFDCLIVSHPSHSNSSNACSTQRRTTIKPSNNQTMCYKGLTKKKQL